MEAREMKMKLTLKRILTSVLAGVTLLFSCAFVGCSHKPAYDDDEFYVLIKMEYKNAFLEREFTVEDFQSKYIESIEYCYWDDYRNEGRLRIKLQTKQKKYLEDVMEEVNGLSFVACTKLIVFVYAT